MTTMKENPATATASTPKKSYEVPVVRREATMPLVTAGSFDLIIPNP